MFDLLLFFFKQKTAYEMRISDWSSDVCSSDLDADGNATTDAQKGYEGVVLPMGGAKGSGLSLMMEIVAGVMSGSAFGGGVRNQYFNFDEPQDVGHCFIALRPDLFMPMETYRERMSELERRCKASPRASGFDDIQMPGEPWARTEAARLRAE